MKLLLVEPPFYRLYDPQYGFNNFPLAMGYLAGTVLKQTDWEVECYNADFVREIRPLSIAHLTGEGYQHYLRTLNDPTVPVWSDVARAIRDSKPDVLGITAKSQNFTSATRVAALAKQVNKDMLVVVGGPHPSMVRGQTLECPHIDVAAFGEGERTLVELLSSVKEGKSLSGIRGIVYRQDGGIVEAAPREFMQNLDELCFPNDCADAVLRDRAHYSREDFNCVFTSRGCPFNCFFCGSREIWSRKVRLRSPANVVAELQKLQAQGIEHVRFVDDTFGVNKKHLLELCQAIRQSCSGLRWDCTFHTQLVGDESLSAMKSAGCRAIHLGVESGSDEVLRAIRKNGTVEQARRACQMVRKHGMSVSCYFIVGFPMETEESLAATISLIKTIPSDAITYSIFTPYPGTEAFQYCRQKGLIPENFDVSLYNHQSPANCFCENIPHARFRQIVSQVEQAIDHANRRRRLRRIMSLQALGRLREVGFRRGIKTGLRILFGR